MTMSSLGVRGPGFALLAALSVLLSGCPPVELQEYYQFAIGNTWEYYLTEGGVVTADCGDGIDHESVEVWTLAVLDDDENAESQRGDRYVHWTRNWADPCNPSQEYTVTHRAFNLAEEVDLTGLEPVATGYTYKWVGNDEGKRNEYFVMAPNGSADWTESWDARVSGDGGGSDFEFEVSVEVLSEPLQVPYARPGASSTYTDVVEYTRTQTAISVNLDGEELVQTQIHVEDYAQGVGLIRYHYTNSEDPPQVTEALLRTTNISVDEED